MKTELIKAILENLEDTCYPENVNWGNENLYIKGLSAALEKALRDCNLKIVDDIPALKEEGVKL